MPVITERKPTEESIIATLGGFGLPLELDRREPFGQGTPQPVAFRFMVRDVPFSCTAERLDGKPVLTLTGDFGALPYMAEDPERRRSIRDIVSAARERSGLEWQVTPQQQVVVRGDITIASPLTPVNLTMGAVTLLLRALPFLELLLEAHED